MKKYWQFAEKAELCSFHGEEKLPELLVVWRNGSVTQ